VKGKPQDRLGSDWQGSSSAEKDLRVQRSSRLEGCITGGLPAEQEK